MEKVVRKMPQGSLTSIPSQVVGILSRVRPPMQNLSNFERKAFKGLCHNANIVILLADKGRSMMPMDKRDYEQKVQLMPDNSNTYKKLCKDASQHLERELNAMLLELKRGGFIPDQLYYRLC